MSDLERARATSSSALTAMRYYLDEIAVPIFKRYKERAYEIGSGTCIKINNRYFIITAGHVINNHNKKDQSILLGGWGKNPQHATNIVNIGLILNPARGIDVGYIEISEEDFIKINKAFIEPSAIQPYTNFLDNDNVLSCGYPGAIIDWEQTDEFNKYTVRASHFQTSTISPDEWPVGYDDEINIILKYPEMAENVDGNSVQLPDAPGISGGGIWTMNARIKGIWSPEKNNLLGIHTMWESEDKYLVGIQIQHLINLINHDYEDINI